MSDKLVKVLVVDDEEGLADFMCKILELKGYAALMETDGVRAVECFIKERPDIVLIDIALGESEIYGMEVLKKIKDIEKETVCIMVTRITEKATVEKAKALGARHYLLKPLDSKDLMAVVQEAAKDIK